MMFLKLRLFSQKEIGMVKDIISRFWRGGEMVTGPAVEFFNSQLRKISVHIIIPFKAWDRIVVS